MTFCNYVPYIILSLFAGSFVDRHSKKAIMLIADIKSVQNILGHVDASTTLNTYACAYEDQKRSVIEDMEAKWIKTS